MATYPCGTFCSSQRTTEAHDWKSDGGTGAGDGWGWGGPRHHGRHDGGRVVDHQLLYLLKIQFESLPDLL